MCTNTIDPRTHTRSYAATAHYIPNRDRYNLTVGTIILQWVLMWHCELWSLHHHRLSRKPPSPVYSSPTPHLKTRTRISLPQALNTNGKDREKSPLNIMLCMPAKKSYCPRAQSKIHKYLNFREWDGGMSSRNSELTSRSSFQGSERICRTTYMPVHNSLISCVD